MSAVGLRSLDRERDRLVRRRVALTARARRMREQLEALERETAQIDGAVEKLDQTVAAVEAVLGAARPPAKARQAPELTEAERRTISAGSNGRPPSDRERVRLALSLKGEMNAWQIAAAAAVPAHSVYMHLTELVKRGEVTKVARGRYAPAGGA